MSNKIDHPLHSDVTLDVSGLTCPGPMVSAKRLLDDLADGQTLLLISDCAGTHDDLAAWAKHTRHQLLHMENIGEKKVAYYIQKGDPWPVNVSLDTVGTRCPGPVIEAAHLLRGLKKGEILKLVSNCESALKDVTSWSSATGHALLGTRRDPNGVMSFYIKA
ncbi:MAG: sulfurtransferase TusA family protein [Pseudomonadota bacterium]